MAYRSFGVGDAVADARATINAGAVVNTDTILAAASLTPDQVSAMASSAYSQLSTQAQATWNVETSQSAGDARVVQGAVAATDLISTGYNPDSDADNQKLIAAVAGAVTLIPGIGLVLGGALALLDVIGIGIAKVLESVGLIWYGCRSSGNWTPAAILADYPGIQTTPGTFGALAVPALMQNASEYMNCKGRMQHQVILAAAASMWNKYASGPPMTIYVPAMGAGNEPFCFSEQGAIAFTPASSVTDLPNGNWALPTDMVGNSLGFPFDTTHAADVGSYVGSGRADPPFILQLTGSVFNPQQAATTISVGATALGAGVAGLVGYLSAYAFLQNVSLVTSAKHLWSGIVGLLPRRVFRENPLHRRVAFRVHQDSHHVVVLRSNNTAVFYKYGERIVDFIPATYQLTKIRAGRGDILIYTDQLIGM